MLDLDRLILKPAMDTFGRTITVYPIVSIPGALPYMARGSWNVRYQEIQTEAGQFIATRQYTLGIRASEFVTVPIKGDKISVAGVVPSLFIVDHHDPDRAGGIILTLKAVGAV